MRYAHDVRGVVNLHVRGYMTYHMLELIEGVREGVCVCVCEGERVCVLELFRVRVSE